MSRAVFIEVISLLLSTFGLVSIEEPIDAKPWPHLDDLICVNHRLPDLSSQLVLEPSSLTKMRKCKHRIQEFLKKAHLVYLIVKCRLQTPSAVPP